ncbi:MAG: hypothetical protein HY896_02235 [Deltaproteobacteria bacterium]|nr:hypothetical protein [Deltaproteobacteria bacterium]
MGVAAPDSPKIGKLLPKLRKDLTYASGVRKPGSRKSPFIKSGYNINFNQA